MRYDIRSKELKSRIESELENYTSFDSKLLQSRVIEAARYSLLGGGKRVRALLTIETCLMLGGSIEVAIPPACAVEMVHSYSLIHDDLPCMDDDDFRRNKPSNHKQYDEATAVLAGDALLSLAFEVLSSDSTEKAMGTKKSLECIGVLSKASGITGMVGGQMIDICYENKYLDKEQHKAMADMKTGALIAAAIHMGCICAGASGKTIALMLEFASAVGTAFQITDDIMDVYGNSILTGKPSQSDVKNNKNTFVTVMGLENAQALAKSLHEKAVSIIREINSEETELSTLIEYIFARCT